MMSNPDGLSISVIPHSQDQNLPSRCGSLGLCIINDACGDHPAYFTRATPGGPALLCEYHAYLTDIGWLVLI